MNEQSSRTETNAAWWTGFFDDNWNRLGFESIEAEQTQRETDFIIQALGLEKTTRVLDLACGVGRHSLELARRGFRSVVGLDFTQTYIKRAMMKAKHEGLKVEFVRGDMKDLPFEDESFDAVLNYYTSFGYFEREEDNQRVLAEVARVLKPGGRFLLDAISRDYIVRHFSRRGWSEHDGEYLLEERAFDLTSSRINSVWTYVTRKGRVERRLSLRIYSLHELRAMLERADLELKEAWGTLEREPLTWDHAHQRVLAARRKNR